MRAQPDDGHHDAPKHVVVASPIASYIIKLVVVIDCCPPIYIMALTIFSVNVLTLWFFLVFSCI